MITIFRDLDEFHRELGTIHAELTTHMDRIKREQPISVANLQELINEPPHQPITYLTKEEQTQLKFTTMMLRELKNNLEDLREKTRESFESKHEFIKILKMSPGDYCLARKIPRDSDPLRMAKVVEQVDRLTYRVKFLDGEEEFTAGFHDLAILTHGLHYPGFVNDSIVGKSFFT